jgi:hypothetical protein
VAPQIVQTEQKAPYAGNIKF